jgi:hypothetical protein
LLGTGKTRDASELFLHQKALFFEWKRKWNIKRGNEKLIPYSA